MGEKRPFFKALLAFGILNCDLGLSSLLCPAHANANCLCSVVIASSGLSDPLHSAKTSSSNFGPLLRGHGSGSIAPFTTDGAAVAQRVICFITIKKIILAPLSPRPKALLEITRNLGKGS